MRRSKNSNNKLTVTPFPCVSSLHAPQLENEQCKILVFLQLKKECLDVSQFPKPKSSRNSRVSLSLAQVEIVIFCLNFFLIKLEEQRGELLSSVGVWKKERKTDLSPKQTQGRKRCHCFYFRLLLSPWFFPTRLITMHQSSLRPHTRYIFLSVFGGLILNGVGECNNLP